MSGLGVFLYWLYAILAVLGVIANILLIDKPRVPITRNMAILVLVVGTLEAFLMLNAVYGFMF